MRFNSATSDGNDLLMMALVIFPGVLSLGSASGPSKGLNGALAAVAGGDNAILSKLGEMLCYAHKHKKE